MGHGDRTPERRPPKRKAQDLGPVDIWQELRQPRGSPRGYRGRLWNLDYRFEYYDTRWNLKPGERLLSYKEFKELAEELNTTMITDVHNEGMRRHREEVLRREYRMVKPTVKPTILPIPRGPRADSVTSSQSPWLIQTPTPQPRERRMSISAEVAKEQNVSVATAVETVVVKATSDSPNTTSDVSIRSIEPRISPIISTRAVQKPQTVPECPPAGSESGLPAPKTSPSESAPMAQKIADVAFAIPNPNTNSLVPIRR